MSFREVLKLYIFFHDKAQLMNFKCIQLKKFTLLAIFNQNHFLKNYP